MDMNPFVAIQSLYPSLSKVGVKIADYIEHDPIHVLNISIQQMAKDLSVAESSIVRFCRIVGFSGFSELKVPLAKHSATAMSTIFEDIDDKESMEAVAQNVFTLNLSTLKTAMEQLNYSDIKEAAELIKNAKRIVICGVAASASIADNFYVHLMRVGFPAVSSTDAELIQIYARLADKDTVFVGICKGGYNTALVRGFRLAQEHGAKTISITAHSKTSIEEVSDVCIIHYAPSHAMVSARIVQNTILDCLFVCATLHRKEDVINQFAKNWQISSFLHIK